MSAAEVTNEKKELDLTDLALEGDEIELNPDGDAFAPPPPPPEGVRYRVRVKHQDGKYIEAFTKKTGLKYISTKLELTILDPGGQFDGSKLFDNVMTLVMQGSGTNRMAGILKALGYAVPARTTDVQLARSFREAVNGEPECDVEVQWEGFSEADNEGNGKTVLKGMKRWPKNPDGSHSNVAVYDKTGEKLTARAVPQAYFALPAAD